MRVKTKQLLHFALLIASILLIFAGYQLYEGQQNLDKGKELFCNRAVRQTVVSTGSFINEHGDGGSSFL